METLYIAGMAAVFVLCLALLSTARRILKPSPLSAGKLSLIPLESAMEPADADVEVDHVDRMTFPRHVEFAPPVPVSETLVLSSITASEDARAKASMTMQEASEQAPPESVSTETVAAPEPPVPPQSLRENKQGEFQFPAYNHILECLLLGLSLVVLVQTQRSTSRFRPLRSSDQVA